MSVDITKIDKNFAVASKIDKDDVVWFDVTKRPELVYGVSYDGTCFRRLPEAVAQTVSPRVHTLSAHTAGGRLRFCTDSSYVAIRAVMPIISRMGHFALTGSAGFDLYADGRFVKTFVPSFKITDRLESVIELGEAKMRQITVDLPLYSAVAFLELGLRQGAVLNKAKPYTYPMPMVFYGSSITQGGCASRPGNCYTAIVSRNLDADHVNLGFSGSGKGERAIAEYIAGLNMSVFIYDYDHNAPDVSHLEATHERMFCIIREKNPQLPVVVLSRPKYYLTELEQQRLAVIRRTYENALAAGDRNVYFIEGKKLMALAENEGTVDGTHPNDLGFASMAKALQPLLSEILEGAQK